MWAGSGCADAIMAAAHNPRCIPSGYRHQITWIDPVAVSVVVDLVYTPERDSPLSNKDRRPGYLDGSGMFCPTSTEVAPDSLKYAFQKSVTFCCSATPSGRRSLVPPRPTPAACTFAFLRGAINLSFRN